jgi:uncharacterized protein
MAPKTPASDHVQKLSTAESERLLKTSDVGRVAAVLDGHPEIFPVNYAFDHGMVVFRLAAGEALERAASTRVAFEVDRLDSAEGVAWSVVVKGTAEDITNAVDQLSEELRRLVINPYAPGQHSEWVAIYAREISGRRFKLRSDLRAKLDAESRNT